MCRERLGKITFMKRVVVHTAIVSAVFVCALSAATGNIEFYVAADGSDANAGTKERPFGSLEAARDAIRKVKKAGALKGAATVWIRRGVYYRTNTFRLTKEDSGTKEAPIVYRNVFVR